jgi:hypothetical protein
MFLFKEQLNNIINLILHQDYTKLVSNQKNQDHYLIHLVNQEALLLVFYLDYLMNNNHLLP